MRNRLHLPFLLVLPCLLCATSAAQEQALSKYPALLTKAAADAEARSASGQAEVEAICFRDGRSGLHTAKYRVVWSPLGLRAEGTLKEIPLSTEDTGTLPPLERQFLAIFNKFEAAVWARQGPSMVMRRYAPDNYPFNLAWLKHSISPAWYRMRGRYPIDLAMAEGELPLVGRVTSRLIDEQKIEFSYTYDRGASRSGRTVYDLDVGGLITELVTDDRTIQTCEWTRDASGRVIPSVLRLSPNGLPSDVLPKECEGFEETFRFTAIDLDHRPPDNLFEPTLLKLPRGTYVDIQKPGESRSYLVGEDDLQAPPPPDPAG